ncbi:hypothetical protein T06_4900 [Trichinella sp. T6]|nr:hypothetical protein T06_4900 [Trichinella sp. T6]
MSLTTLLRCVVDEYIPNVASQCSPSSQWITVGMLPQL